MSDAEKALASPPVPVPPAPSRRAKLFAAVLGVLLLCGGGWCLWIFAESPSGELPWLPGTWKGAPLILGACFGGVYGALLLILRRFSLRGMLLCSILSAALAGGLTAYVQTITETQTISGSVKVAEGNQEAMIEKLRGRVTQERIVHFLRGLHGAGKLDGVQDFESVTLTMYLNSSKTCIDYQLRFEFLAFVHTRSSQVREVSARYVNALLNMYCLAGRRAEWDQKNYVPYVMYLEMQNSSLSNASEAFRFLHKNPKAFGEIQNSEEHFLIPETTDASFDPFYGLHGGGEMTEGDFGLASVNKRFHWIAQHEEDPVIRDCIRDFTRAIMVALSLSTHQKKESGSP